MKKWTVRIAVLAFSLAFSLSFAFAAVAALAASSPPPSESGRANRDGGHVTQGDGGGPVFDASLPSMPDGY